MVTDKTEGIKLDTAFKIIDIPDDAIVGNKGGAYLMNKIVLAPSAAKSERIGKFDFKYCHLNEDN